MSGRRGGPCPAGEPSGRSGWLRPLHDWPRALLRLLDVEPGVARVVVAGVRGSTPRDAGVCMLVAAHQVEGTIGGGQLEWQAIAAARELLAGAAPGRLQRLVLAADVGQCCGGIVELWLERYGPDDRAFLRTAKAAAARGACVLASRLTPPRVERELVTMSAAGMSAAGTAATNGLLVAPRACAAPRLERPADGRPVLLERLDADLPAVWLYGAGHVGQALARILVDLPVALSWIDSRADLLPRALGESVELLLAQDPAATVGRAPPGARFLVLTHSHALDYALCRAILGRDDFATVGLIGSASKSARFRARLAREGVPRAAIARLECPIGIAGIPSKWPAAIAVAVAAQLLRELGRDAAPAGRTPEAAGAAVDRAPSDRVAPDCAAGACADCASPRSMAVAD